MNSVSNYVFSPIQTLRDLAETAGTVASVLASGVATLALAIVSPIYEPADPFRNPYDVMVSDLNKKSPHTLAHIEEEMKNPDFQLKVGGYLDELREIIGQKNLNHPFMRRKDFAYIVLEGLKREIFSRIQAATLLHTHALLTDELFDPNQVTYHPIDEQAMKRWILPSFMMNYAPNEEALRKEIGQLPDSERGFFVIPNQRERQNKGTLVQRLFQVRPMIPMVYNQIGDCSIPQTVKGAPYFHDHRIIPSIGMMQAYINAAFPEKQRVKISPNLGLSLVGSIRQNGIDAERSLYVPAPGIQIPKRVDEQNCFSAADVSLHDGLVHAVRLACTPLDYRYAFIHTSDDLRDEKNMNSLCPDKTKQAILKKTVWNLRDMDFISPEEAYFANKPLTLESVRDRDIRPITELNSEGLNLDPVQIEKITEFAMERIEFHRDQYNLRNSQ